MAWLFGSQGLQYNSAASALPMTAAPYTVAGWFYPTASSTGYLWTLQDALGDPGTGHYAKMRMDSTGELRLQRNAGSTQVQAATANQATLNAWNHFFCSINTSSPYSTHMLNGGTAVTSTANRAATVSQFLLAYQIDATPVNFFTGRMAHIAVWNVALTQAEAAILAAGEHPMAVRPESLVYCAPLWGDDLTVVDLEANRAGVDTAIDGVGLVKTGSPTKAPHACITYRTHPLQCVKANTTGQPLAVVTRRRKLAPSLARPRSYYYTEPPAESPIWDDPQAVVVARVKIENVNDSTSKPPGAENYYPRDSHANVARRIGDWFAYQGFSRGLGAWGDYEGAIFLQNFAEDLDDDGGPVGNDLALHENLLDAVTGGSVSVANGIDAITAANGRRLCLPIASSLAAAIKAELDDRDLCYPALALMDHESRNGSSAMLGSSGYWDQFTTSDARYATETLVTRGGQGKNADDLYAEAGSPAYNSGVSESGNATNRAFGAAMDPLTRTVNEESIALTIVAALKDQFPEIRCGNFGFYTAGTESHKYKRGDNGYKDSVSLELTDNALDFGVPEFFIPNGEAVPDGRSGDTDLGGIEVSGSEDPNHHALSAALIRWNIEALRLRPERGNIPIMEYPGWDRTDGAVTITMNDDDCRMIIREWLTSAAAGQGDERIRYSIWLHQNPSITDGAWGQVAAQGAWSRMLGALQAQRSVRTGRMLRTWRGRGRGGPGR